MGERVRGDLRRLREVIERERPELVLTGYTRGHEARAVLLDRREERLGELVFEEVSTLCLTSAWESFAGLELHRWRSLPEAWSWLRRAMPEHQVLVVLLSAHAEGDSSLPIVDGRRAGYVICEALRFEAS